VRFLLSSIAIALSCASCLPFAVPPGQVSLATHASPPGPPPVADRLPLDRRGEELVVRGGLHPQQLFPSERTRVVDVGAGYRIGASDGRTSAHGPYAEIDVFPYVHRSGGMVTRLGVRNVAEALYDTEGRHVGWGASGLLSAELAGFVRAAGASGGRGDVVAGAAYGEVALGLFAGVSHREVDGQSTTQLTAGISGRIPAAVGIVCCAKR